MARSKVGKRLEHMWENSPEDKRKDKAMASKRGESVKEFEASEADEKMDAKGMKKMKKKMKKCPHCGKMHKGKCG